MITGDMADTDWKCPVCKRWRRHSTQVCTCGHIPRYRLTRKARRGRGILGYPIPYKDRIVSFIDERYE